eukprot:762769-Hanusia_phi.AAC.3
MWCVDSPDSRGYMNRNLLPTYGMCRSDGHVSIKKVQEGGGGAFCDEMRREFLGLRMHADRFVLMWR